MFTGSMTYYHGTTTYAWDSIRSDRVFRPDKQKADGEYWTAKGVYFSCSNPYVALWYAHFRCFLLGKDGIESSPVVITFEKAIDDESDVVNLLTSDGQRVLFKMHNRLKPVHSATKNAVTINTNLDALALKHLPDMEDVENICVFSAFQEGESFQKIVHGHDFVNEYINDRVGFCVGDNVSVCFLDDVPLLSLGDYKVLTSDHILDEDMAHGENALFPVICQGLNNKLLAGKFAKSSKAVGLHDYFLEVCHAKN
ncbi:hypothetical protein [Fundidesulfovibrio terrae]|uniref:hypothetical protein n=1 Tax=Fundidesulfovibrio terrae TaxID=2922866 RepID=UPI001FB02F4B|nr:hypothetical protein [Fundidesulfovibrio terrae]